MCDGVQLSQLCIPNIALGIPALTHGRKSKRVFNVSLGVSLKTILTLLKLFFRLPLCANALFLEVNVPVLSSPQLQRQSEIFLITNLHERSQQGKVEQMFDTWVPRIAGNIFESHRSASKNVSANRSSMWLCV